MENLLNNLLSHQWTFIAAVALVLLAVSEWGLRTGSRLHTARDEARKSQISGVQGAVLGLLGLLLGFTFAMAVGRNDARRNMVLQEANTIGTTWLRTDLLPGDHPEKTKDLLRRYVDIRISYRDISNDPTKMAEGLKMSTRFNKPSGPTRKPPPKRPPPPSRSPSSMRLMT